MPDKLFKFVSPGVQVAETDNSQLPKTSFPVGPIVVGRTERGPAMKPVTVGSFSEFVELFGNPIPGGRGGDIWREGNYSAPTYASYAAQAWLKNNSPVTVIRLLGCQHSNATEDGVAGWSTENSPSTTLDENGGAFGLFVGNYDSGSIDGNQGSMVLSAIFYVEEGSIRLTGSSPQGDPVDGAAVVVKSIGSNFEFKAIIEDGSGAGILTSSFNFDKNSAIYIRKVFNTNPTLYGESELINEDDRQYYWLGETFDKHLTSTLTGSTSANGQIAVILPLQSTEFSGGDFGMGMQSAKSGWIFSQHMSSTTGSFDPKSMTKLFRFVTHDNGEWEQRNLKISLSNIKTSRNQDDPYGFFSVEIRKVKDSDNTPVFVERFDNVNLNPSSDNFIAKRIGDTYLVWDDDERRYREFGNFANSSKFVRIELNPSVETGMVDPRLLPFGFWGTPNFATVSYTSGSLAGTTPLRGLDSVPAHTQREGTAAIDSGITDFSCSFEFPKLNYRVSNVAGNLVNNKRGYWGVISNISSTSNRFEESYVDVVRAKPVGIDSYDEDSDVGTTTGVMFSLDDIAWTSGSQTDAEWAEGNRVAGTSITAGTYYNTEGNVQYKSTASYEYVLDAGFNRFTLPLFGGFDGLSVTVKEPFGNFIWEGESPSETTDAMFNTVKRAIDTFADPEMVEGNLAAIPGITQVGLTDHLLNVCESRGDMMAIIDLEGGFKPNTENNLGDSDPANRGDVDQTISNLKFRGLNTSYGAAFYPWVQIRDTINGAYIWVPPSVVALGTLGSSEGKSELWFAPAGFTRGGLSEGSAGMPVLNVREKLTSTQRDRLYEANINPIGNFPNQGIVIFGQKTLQVTPSAVDRINVRRLMIFLKKEISRMAARVLFDPNVSITWNRFLGEAEPFLDSVKVRYGISEYKFILDETTTTPELVDRNIMYAKIMVKPVKAIEFIGLEFVITNQGASFDD
jgi:hypothetical protein